jgi:hypothetical protein
MKGVFLDARNLPNLPGGQKSRRRKKNDPESDKHGKGREFRNPNDQTTVVFMAAMLGI